MTEENIFENPEKIEDVKPLIYSPEESQSNGWDDKTQDLRVMHSFKISK